MEEEKGQVGRVEGDWLRFRIIDGNMAFHQFLYTSFSLRCGRSIVE